MARTAKFLGYDGPVEMRCIVFLVSLKNKLFNYKNWHVFRFRRGGTTMKIQLYFYAVITVFLTSCASQNQVVQSNQVEVANDTSLALRIHQKINEHRQSIGKKPLEYHKGLSQMAEKHSRYMAAKTGSFNLEGDQITHYGFSSRSVLAKAKYRIPDLSENVIASHSANRNVENQFLRDWLNSKNHRYNLESNWVYSGVGVALDEQGRVYATQLFGSAQAHQPMSVFPESW